MTAPRAHWFAALALAIAPRIARAQETDPTRLATRRALIEQAERSRDAGLHDVALDLAQRAAQVEITPSLRLFIAQEQYAIGRIAEALGNADACARESDATPASSHRDVVHSTCEALVTMLRERVGTIVVSIATPPPDGLVVMLDSHPLPSTFWNVPYVVTPGTVRIEANAPGFSAPIVRSATVTARAQVTIAIESGPASSTAPPVLDVHAEPAHVPVHRTRTDARPLGPGPAILAISGGVGLIGAGAALAAWGLTIAQCTNAVCPDDATRTRVYAFGALTWTGVGVAAIGFGSALAWALSARSDRHPQVGFGPVPGGAMVSYGAVF